MAKVCYIPVNTKRKTFEAIDEYKKNVILKTLRILGYEIHRNSKPNLQTTSELYKELAMYLNYYYRFSDDNKRLYNDEAIYL